MQTFERGIDHHCGQIRMGFFAMMLVLFVEMQGLSGLVIVGHHLLKTGIVHLAQGNQGIHQGVRLCLIWEKPILKSLHEGIVTCGDSTANKQGLRSLNMPHHRH